MTSRPFPPKNKNEEKSNWHTQILRYILGSKTFNESKMMGFSQLSSIRPFIHLFMQAAAMAVRNLQFAAKRKKESNHEIPKINMMQPKSMLWNYLKRRVKVQRMDNKFAMKLCRLKVYFAFFIFVHPPSV